MTAKLDLNAFLLFFEVVNARSINQAAKRLHMPKSSVSRKLAALERQVGALLVKRGTRTLTTTDIGRAFYEHCGHIAEQVGLAAAEVFEMQTQLRGTLRVSMPIDFGVSWLSRLISTFSKRYPDVRLAVDVNDRWVDVATEPYDVAIHIGGASNLQLPSRRVATLNRGLYASPEYLARKGIPTGIEELRLHDCVVHRGQIQEGVWSIYDDIQGDKVQEGPRITVNNVGVTRQLVIGGAGIGILPNLMCENDVRTGRLQRILAEHQFAPLAAMATFISRRQIPKRTRVFIDFIAERLAA